MTVELPDGKQCARAECHKGRTAEGHHQYCSKVCRTISASTHGPPLPALPEWTWAPRNAERYP